MLTEETVIDKIEVLPELNIIQVRRATRVLRNNETIATTLHRTTYTIEADVSHEDPLVQALMQVIRQFRGAE